MKKLRAILFDLDDTLYPEHEYVLSGFLAVAEWIEKEFGFSAETSYGELAVFFESGTRGNIFNQWLSQHSLDNDSYVPQMVEIYRRHEPQISPYPDVKETLEQLHNQCPLGLISDGYLEVQRRKWKALRLERYFQTVIFTDIWGREYWKPSIRPFNEAASQLSVPCGEIAYVADNPSKDFRGARASGMGSIRIRREDGLYNNQEPVSPDDAPDSEVLDLHELIKLL